MNVKSDMCLFKIYYSIKTSLDMQTFLNGNYHLNAKVRINLVDK